jgi:hypothetical protein
MNSLETSIQNILSNHPDYALEVLEHAVMVADGACPRPLQGVAAEIYECYFTMIDCSSDRASVLSLLQQSIVKIKQPRLSQADKDSIMWISEDLVYAFSSNPGYAAELKDRLDLLCTTTAHLAFSIEVLGKFSCPIIQEYVASLRSKL